MNSEFTKTCQQIRRIDVPLWAFSHLGKVVSLSKVVRQNEQEYPVGTRFILDGITSQNNGNNLAVLTDEDDRADIVAEVPFSFIEEPVEAGTLVPGLYGRLGEVLFLWQHGFDLRKGLSKATFYRYRASLLAHSIDICKPCPVNRSPRTA